MKVLNYITSYLAIILLVIISIWAGIFYYAMLGEIYDSIDDGLDNQKGLILQKVAVDSTILNKVGFEEGDYAIREISAETARNFRDVYSDTSMFMQNEQDFEPVRLLNTAFEHKGRYYQMQVVTSMVEEDDLVRELLYALIWLYAGLIITILILNNFLLKRTWRPFYQLLAQLKNFRLEKPVVETPPTKIEEFRLLNEAVQKMVQGTTDSYNSQKHFIENASHELQTPLAISINKLEALAEGGRLTSEDAKLLQTALNNLERLTRLNRSLLLLSKIENRQFASEEDVNINELVNKIIADFHDQLQFNNLSVEMAEQETCTVNMNHDLALIMITNLVKNAVVHNYKGGKITIDIRRNSLTVGNTGKAEPLNRERLFQRFYKEDETASSTGLGLAIVKAIAEAYGFSVDYSFRQLHLISVSFNK
jgi:signal transduction histidine kinase